MALFTFINHVYTADGLLKEWSKNPWGFLLAGTAPVRMPKFFTWVGRTASGTILGTG
jgi:hypothetical protein